MSVGKIAIATILLFATFAGCEWYATIIPPTHWAYAIFVNFIFLAVATALMTALKLPLFPTSYFASKSFERNGRIYRWAGIQFFVSILRFIGWERFWRKQNPVQNNVATLRRYAQGTIGAEAVHALAGICTIGLTVSIAIRYSWSGTKWLWIANIMLNLYPVMLQRYNRPRAERLVRRVANASSQSAGTEQTRL
ncbi:MAG: hypothetical protein RIK87_02540 [Fuerstiella sp.]